MRLPWRPSGWFVAILLVPGGGRIAAQVPDVAVERQLALDLGLQIGDTILLGTAAESVDREAVVAAIYEPRPDPAEIAKRERHIRLHLPDLAALLGVPDRVDRFGLGLRPGVSPD